MTLRNFFSPRLQAAVVAAVLLFAAAFRLSVLDLPFAYHPEGEGSVFAVFARNLLRYDWTATRGMNVFTVGATRAEGREALEFCPDHPPTTSLLIALSFALFGVGEWQTRLPGALLTLACAFSLYRLIAMHVHPRAGPLAAAFFVGTPMIMLFGGMPDIMGVQLTFCALLTVGAYLRFVEAPSGARFVALAGAFALATLADWPAYFLGPVMALHFAFAQPARRWGWMVMLGAIAVVLFAGMYGYVVYAAGSPWNWMWELLSVRTGLGEQPWAHGRGWWSTAFEFNVHCHTWPLLLLGAVWVATRGWRMRGLSPAETATQLLFAWAALHVFVGRQGIYVHEWWWAPLTPALAAAAALSLERAWTHVESAGYVRSAAAAVAGFAAVFMAWNAASARSEFRNAATSVALAPAAVGEAIRRAAPQPDDVAIVVFGTTDPRLWYYGDRALKVGAWTVEDFERRLADEKLDLPYGFEQASPKRPSGLVVPRGYEHGVSELVAYLHQRFPAQPLPAALADQFFVFDLRAPERIAP